MNKSLRWLLVGLLFAAVAVCANAATGNPPFNPGNRDLKVTSTQATTPKLLIQGPGSQAVDLVQIYSGGNKVYAVPSNGVMPVIYGGTGASKATNAQVNLGVQAGTLTTAADGTRTNTFATAFTVAPIVVTVKSNTDTATNQVVSVTTTNFVYKGGAPSLTVNWIAIGAP